MLYKFGSTFVRVTPKEVCKIEPERNRLSKVGVKGRELHKKKAEKAAKALNKKEEAKFKKEQKAKKKTEKLLQEQMRKVQNKHQKEKKAEAKKAKKEAKKNKGKAITGAEVVLTIDNEADEITRGKKKVDEFTVQEVWRST